MKHKTFPVPTKENVKPLVWKHYDNCYFSDYFFIRDMGDATFFVNSMTDSDTWERRATSLQEAKDLAQERYVDDLISMFLQIKKAIKLEI